MNYLKTYERWTNYSDIVDDILDKINSSGINSLNASEKDFLDAYRKNNYKQMDDLIRDFNARNFSDKYFSFKYSHSEETGDETRYYGTIFVPDLVWEDGKTVNGEIEGYICKLSNHQLVPYFDKGDYDILEFCNGLEYELDNFLEYVVNTLEDEKSVE